MATRIKVDGPAIGLAEERAELRRSLPDRCELAAEGQAVRRGDQDALNFEESA